MHFSVASPSGLSLNGDSHSFLLCLALPRCLPATKRSRFEIIPPRSQHIRAVARRATLRTALATVGLKTDAECAGTQRARRSVAWPQAVRLLSASALSGERAAIVSTIGVLKCKRNELRARKQTLERLATLKRVCNWHPPRTSCLLAPRFCWQCETPRIRRAKGCPPCLARVSAMVTNAPTFLFGSCLADHVREFSCGNLHYRTFYLDAKKDVLYVGAM